MVGAVERHRGRYRVGGQLYRIGQAWQPHPGLRLAARQPLHGLRAATGASVVVTVLYEDLALTIASVPGEVEPVAPVRDGMGFTLDTAAGQVLTAGPPRRAAGRPETALLEREQVMEGVLRGPPGVFARRSTPRGHHRDGAAPPTAPDRRRTHRPGRCRHHRQPRQGREEHRPVAARAAPLSGSAQRNARREGGVRQAG